MKSIFFLLIIIIIIAPRTSVAQINPYARLTDPRAIARLDGEDSEPLRYATRFGYPPDRDPIDSNFIFAQDSGAGIITHIWMTGSAADSTTNFKLYIDDTLIFSNTLEAFFQKIHGVLRPPFDSLYPGASVCDVQIPYRKKFKITYIGEGWNVYSAFAWRPVMNPQSIQSFQFSQPYSVEYHQQAAENRYETSASPWLGEKPLHLFDTVKIAPASKIILRELTGPAMIQKLKFSFSRYDFDVLDSLWLNIYWGGSPYPAVHVPVSDFFCASNGGLNVHSYEIRTDSSGLTSYFPMPFTGKAKIELVNNSKDSLKLTSLLDYTSEKIDKNSYGYFHAFFSEANPTRYHIYFHALYETGIGKFVGFYLYCPQNNLGVVLEGAPIFTIDSNPRNYIHYTGGEDYYNSGWWFLGQTFSKPFAGHTNFIKGFYRFHFFDAIDFKKSIDLEYQPGKSIDIVAHYRSIAYYYKQPISFWVSRDTIRPGERWSVTGTGYTPNSTIVAKFDSSQVIFTTTANSDGVFNAVLIVPSSAKLGVRKLSINDESRPEPIYILGSPAIRPIADSLPLTLRYRDSLLITGTGFDPGEKIQIYLDSILISDTAVIVQSDYRFFTTVRMPNIADWKYHLRAIGDHHNEAMASDLITITRILPFEFEDIVPWAVPESGLVYYKNMSADWGDKWSHQATAVFEAKGIDQKILFKFFIPANDTFDVKLFLSAGVKYGNYSYAIDGKYFGKCNGFHPDPYYDDYETPSDTFKLGTLYFPKDTHTIVFTCLGKDSAAKEYRLGADLLLLTPTTKMSLPKGVFVTPNDSTKSLIDSPDVLNSYISAYPNPVDRGEITLGINFLPGITDGLLDITLTDIIGRKLRAQSAIAIGVDGANAKFDVHTLPSGNYIAEFTIHSGSIIQHISRLVEIRE